MRSIYLYLFFLITIYSQSQTQKKVLFIGNSYTSTYDIPELTEQIAIDAGDQLSYTSHAPGGATLQQHNNNSQVSNLINQGDWDYVVLQEQSQLPAFPEQDVINQVYPYATALSDKIKKSNPCAKITFYMTWGRKNGDQANCSFWQPLCTYLSMDNLLQQRYTTMATTNKGILAPVAAVWRELITNNPQLNLYSSDESHPSIEGAMAAAYTFYTVFFEKAPSNSTFTNNLPPATITAIKTAVTNIVYNNLSAWKIYAYDPVPDFENIINNNEVNFTNLSSNSQDYLWDLGDGTTTTSKNPNHIYTNTGVYQVKLTATKCKKSVTIEKTINITTLSTTNYLSKSTFLFPNPASNQIEFHNTETIQTIEIIDSSGKTLIPKYSISQNNYLIDISTLANGTYYIQIKVDEKTSSYPFIKK